MWEAAGFQQLGSLWRRLVDSIERAIGIRVPPQGPWSLLPEGISEPFKSMATTRTALKLVEDFMAASHPADRHRQLQYISQMSHFLPDATLELLAQQGLQDENPVIRGEACYALGRAGNPRFMLMLKELLGRVRKESLRTP